LWYSRSFCWFRMAQWKAHFVAIYGIPAHFADLVWHNGKHILSLYTVFPLTLLIKDGILESTFCCYIWCSSSLCWPLVAKWLPDGFRRLILSNSGTWWPNGSQMASEGSFWAILAPGSQMAPRWSQEAHFEHFWHLVAKWLPDGLRKLIWGNSGTWWPNGSQMVSEGSVWSILALGDQMAPRWLQKAHVEQFWHLIAKLLRGASFCRYLLHSCSFCWFRMP